MHLNMDYFDMVEQDSESSNGARSNTFSCGSEDEVEELDPEIREASMDEDELEDCLKMEEMNEIEELRQWALSGNPTIPHSRIK